MLWDAGGCWGMPGDALGCWGMLGDAGGCSGMLWDAGGCSQSRLHGRSAQAAEQGTLSAPEALPKDRAVNCYLSNEAVSDCLG